MNRTSWIFIASTIVIVIILGIFYYRPTLGETFNLVKQNRETIQNTADANAKINQLSKLEKNDQIESLYQISRNYIPLEEKSSELILEISGICQQSNLRVDQISLDAPKINVTTDEEGNQKKNAPKSNVPGGAQEVSFSLKVVGSFQSYLNFLSLIEQSSRLISIENMSLSQQQASGFSATLTGKAYYKATPSLNSTLSNISLSDETVKKLQNLKPFGQPIDIKSQDGFGRVNPFETY